MLDIAAGGFFLGPRFPDVPTRKKRKSGEFWLPTRPQRFYEEKLPELERLAAAAGIPDVLAPIREVWDRDLRNAVFHADYSIHCSETRIPAKAKTYSDDEIETLVNRALAYHEAVAVLVKGYRRSYAEPEVVALHPDHVTHPDERAVVMVREGEGAIGLKHAYTADEVRAGAIAWHVARLSEDEAKALRADPTLAMFQARSP